MNAELSAMNKISTTMQRELDKLDSKGRERVLAWFIDWAQDVTLDDQRAQDEQPTPAEAPAADQPPGPRAVKSS